MGGEVRGFAGSAANHGIIKQQPPGVFMSLKSQDEKKVSFSIA